VNDHHRILAVALTPAEVALVVRAVRAHRTEQFRTKADVIHMLEHALDDRDCTWLGMSPMGETQAAEEIAS
jgi:hypothetical protein